MKLKITYLKAVYSIEQLPAGGVSEFPIFGRSNVGKSSLINYLAGGRKIARVSKTPGKTRMLHYYDVSGRFRLVDLPGYGFARLPPKERNRFEKLALAYLSERNDIQAFLLLLDARHGITKLDRVMLNMLQHYPKEILFILTKCDKLKRGQLAKVKAVLKRELLTMGFDDSNCIATSTVAKFGKQELFRALTHLAGNT